MALTQSVRATVIEHLLEASEGNLTAADITDQTSISKDLVLGSLQAVSLMLDLEDALHISVETEELASLKTVGDLFRMIESKLPGEPTTAV